MVEARLCVLPLLLLWAGPAAVLLAHLSLGQFKLFYSALEHLSRKSDGFWKFTQPVLQQPVQQLRACFGTSAEFSPNPSQVMLIALLLAVIVSTERIIITIQRTSNSVPRKIDLRDL